MNILVTVLAPQTYDVDSAKYATNLPLECIAVLEVEARGYKEWSAYVEFKDGLVLQTSWENGCGDLTFERTHTKSVPHGDGTITTITTTDTVFFDDGDVLCVESNGTEWTVDEILDGLKAVVYGEAIA